MSGPVQLSITALRTLLHSLSLSLTQTHARARVNISMNSCGLFVIAVRNALPSIDPVSEVAMLNVFTLLSLQMKMGERSYQFYSPLFRLFQNNCECTEIDLTFCVFPHTVLNTI
jgi:hypothetical protein